MNSAQQCPLCGQANQCAVAAGEDGTPCWCFEARIDPAALQRLTPEQRNQACLCPRCGGAVTAMLDEQAD